ncbi:MAG: hypothetical protein ACI8TQ_000691 [Planctomycetota bacterium]|jgi:hypothetical protein
MVKALVTSNTIRRSLLAGEMVTAIRRESDRRMAPSKSKISDGRAAQHFSLDEIPGDGVCKTSQAHIAARRADQTHASIDPGNPRTPCARSNRLLVDFKAGEWQCSPERRPFFTRFQSGSAGIGSRIDVSSHASVDLSGG